VADQANFGFHRGRVRRHWIKCGIRLVVVCALALWAAAAFPTDDPEALQKQAKQILDQYTDHLRRTGDRVSLLPQVQRASNELLTSSQEFLVKQNFAGASLSFRLLGDIERLQEHWNPAFQFYSKARESAQRARRADYEAKALIGMARVAGFGGKDLGAAKEYITEAIRLATAASDKQELFDALDIAAELAEARGELATASEYLERAFPLLENSPDKLQALFFYMDRGGIYYDRGGKCDYDRNFELCDQAFQLSHADYEQALRIANELGFQFLASQLQGLLQSGNARRKLVQSQARYQQNVAAIAGPVFHPKKASDVLVTQHFGAGPNPELQAQINSLLPKFDSADPRGLYIQGLSEQMKGNADMALRDFQSALDLLERDRRKLQDDESRGTFLEDKIGFYYAPTLLLLDLHRPAEAFALMERSRSRAMADLLASSSLALPSPQERDLFSQLLKLKADVGLAQQRLFRMTPEERQKHAEEVARTEAQIKKLQDAYQNLEARIQKEAPKLQDLMVSQTVSLENVQRLARVEKFDVLYYLVTESGVMVWHIGADDVTVLNVFLPRTQTMSKAAALRNSLQDPGNPFDEQTSKELFLYLVQPVLKSVKTRHLVIVPHEDLNHIPFQVLQDPVDGTFLGEKFQISYAPSATVLAALQDKPKIAGGRLLALANPEINAATSEVKAIGLLYPGRSKIVTEVLAKKEDVKAWAPSYNLLHFSVHGRFKESDPLLSYLELGPTEKDDGHLTAAEMFGLPLPKGSLVVLSACETGRVTATHSNEILGMTRALLYAGASELVLSSWEVDAASTKLWMETFYREAQTNTASEAARLALLAVKARPEYRHPYYWSPFLVTGK
jgi:CHAT domain-containing protein